MQIFISHTAQKQLLKTPDYIRTKLSEWTVAVENYGLAAVRKKYKGFHDEPLQGQRQGERSIRLNKQWRAIYILYKDGTIECLEITEVMPHDY